MSSVPNTSLPGRNPAPKTWFYQIHFGGTREYVDDEDGFQVFYARRRGRKGRWSGQKKSQEVNVKAAQPFIALAETY